MRVIPVQLQTAFGGYVAEQHDEETHSARLLVQSEASGIAGIWLAFYAAIAVAAVVQYVGAAMAHHIVVALT
jgi:hypothetical protein